jgi:malate permease and related proteins
MTAFLTLLGSIGEVLALVGIGLVLRLTGLLKPSDAKTLNNVIIYVGLPAFIFQAVHPARLGPELPGIALVGWVVILAAMALAWAVSRGLRMPAALAGAFILASALGNTGYIGYPVARELLGQAGLVRAIFYDVFATVGALLLVGLLVAEHYSPHEHRVNVAREVLTFPAVIALAAALALRSVAVPIPVSHGLDALASLVVPLIMISVGLSLKLGEVRRHAPLLAALAGIKLIAEPLLALALAAALGQPADVTRLVVMQAGMPSMMLGLAIAMRFGLDADFVASAILVTTAASVVTVPLLQLLAM